MKNLIIIILIIALVIALYFCFSKKPSTTCTLADFKVANLIDTVIEKNGSIIIKIDSGVFVYPLTDINDRLYKAGERVRYDSIWRSFGTMGYMSPPKQTKESWLNEFMGAKADTNNPWQCPKYCAIQLVSPR